MTSMKSISLALRLFTCFALMALGATAGAQTGEAAQYPSRSVRVVVPYPPGGPTDIAARAVFQKVSEILRQPFVIDNKSGGAGNIGAAEVARAPADGYTLLLATTQHAINKSLFQSLNYDVQSSLAPVSLISEGPLLLVTAHSQPLNSVKDVLEAARKGHVTFASAGNGGSVHLAGELFNEMGGVKMQHIPYRGSAPALTDVISGQVTIMIDSMLSALPFVKAGKLKALGISSTTRSSALPDVPTIAEAGLPGYEVIAWNGVLAPTGTPRPVLDKLGAALAEALKSTELNERFRSLGFNAKASSPDEFRKYLAVEVQKWRKVVVAGKVVAE